MPKKKDDNDDDDDISDIVDEEESGEARTNLALFCCVPSAFCLTVFFCLQEDEEASNDLSNADIVTKYRTAGDIVNKTLLAVVAAVKPGVKAVDLCNIGDTTVEEATSKIYNQKKEGKKIEKGTAFPTCVSVNNCVGHYSPLLSEDKVVLAEGDLVKIDLGVHVDGYVAVVAHTLLCTDGDAPMDGRKADVCMAAWTDAHCAAYGSAGGWRRSRAS